MIGSDGTSMAQQLRAQAAAHGAHNYHPLPVVIAEAEGAWVTDVHGHRYLCLLYTSPSPRDRTRSRMPSSA